VDEWKHNELHKQIHLGKAIGFRKAVCLKGNQFVSSPIPRRLIHTFRIKLMTVKPIPEGYHTVTPYMVVSQPGETIEFLAKTFNATVADVMRTNDGRVMHAGLTIGDSKLMLAASMENFPAQPSSFYLYVKDTDSTYRQAVAAGGMSVMEPADQFYGDRNAGVKDPSGNTWWIATHFEDVSPQDMKLRMKEREAQNAMA
jgi:PhnB protein